MISKGTIRYIKSLQLKKYRKKAQSFLVEGTKSVLELLNAPFEVTHLIGTEAFLIENAKVTTKLNVPLQLVSEKQLSAMGALKNNRSVLAVAKCPLNEPITVEDDALMTPQAVIWRGQRHRVERVAKRWRVDKQWWLLRIWREYFKVATQTGYLVVLYRDLQTGGWYLQRWYD